MRKITVAKAINEAIREEMARDKKVYFVGEDIGLYHYKNGPCGVSTGIMDEFPERVVETPIAEQAIIGTSTGAAMFGMRPIVEIMHSEFITTATEHVVYGGSKASVMNGIPCPIVIRAPFGGVIQGNPVQNENNEAFFANTPGLKIVIPSNAYDAKGLFKSAVRDDYPVLFLEHNGIYRMEGDVPEEEYLLPLGKADVKREGSDISIITYGNVVNTALEAGRLLAGEGMSCEVIDLRTILPLDMETIVRSIQKTRHALVAHEARKTGGFGGEIVASIMEHAFSYLDAPVLRVAGPDVPANYPRLPEDIIEGVKRTLGR